MRKRPLYLRILAAILLGSLTGILVGPRTAPLAIVAKFFVEAFKLFAVPLLFMAIFDAITRRDFTGRGIVALLLICVLNACLAVTIGLGISNLFHPGQYLKLKAERFEGLVQKSGAEAVLTSPMVAAIFLGVLLGLAALLLLSPSRRERVQAGIQTALKKLMVGIEWSIRFVPLAVFCSVAAVVGKNGFSFLSGIGAYLLSCLGGMALHVLLVYQGWVIAVPRIGLRRFWREAREPAFYAFGINSSLATLPLTLKSLDKLGVSSGAARLSACVGTNLNNDGILLYEVVAVFFLTQAYGIPLSFMQQLTMSVLCLAATIGVGGIPEAGILSLSLVLTASGLPSDAIPMLLTVDWVIGRCRSFVNVLGDMVGAIGIDALTKKA